VLLNFENKIQWSPDVLWISTRKKVSCDHSKSKAHLTPVSNFLSLSTSFLMSDKHYEQRKKLSVEGQLCVRQIFGKEFNICAKKKSHNESKPHIDCDGNFILMFK